MDSEFDDAFLAGYDVLKIPIMINGKPVWEERFPLSKIEKIKKSVGVNRFLSQMMLTPVNISEGRFDVNKLSFYSLDLIMEEQNRLLNFRIGEHKIESVSCWWDPAFGSVNGDGSVVSVVFVDSDGKYFLHDMEYLYFNTAEGEYSAREQCVKVAEFLKRNFVPVVYVESNGIGKFLPEFLRGELLKMGVNCQVVAKTSRISKVLRIVDAFDAVCSAGYLFVNEKVKNTPFIAEFTDWNTDSNEHDDGLDSVAGALTAEPVKMPVSSLRSQVRKFGNKTFKIRTDFKI